MGIKMLDDFVQENGTPEQIKAYQEYSKKLDSAPVPCSFIVCNEEVANVLNEILNEQ